MGKKRLRREIKALERINASLTASNASVREDLDDVIRRYNAIAANVGEEPGDSDQHGPLPLATVVRRRMTELREWRQGWRTAEPSVFGPMQEERAIVDWDVFGEEGSLRTARTLAVCSGRPWGSTYQHCWNYPFMPQTFAPFPCATMAGCGWQIGKWRGEYIIDGDDEPVTHPCSGAS